MSPCVHTPGDASRLFATLYDTDADNILLVNHPLALAVKVSLPRPMVQSDLHDPDCYAGNSTHHSWTWK